MEAKETFHLPRAKSAALQAVTHGFLEDVAEASLAGAAKRAALSTRTFRRRFNAEMGVTWKEYVHWARMLKAMELLTTSLNVTEVSLAVGFQSLSAFSKAFRQFTRQNPLEFKQSSTVH